MRKSVTITYATITDEEIQAQPGIDIGSIQRMLKAKGFEAKGHILPRLKGTVVKHYNERCLQYEFMQITEFTDEQLKELELL